MDLDTTAQVTGEILDSLKKIYKEDVLPLETSYKYERFYAPPLKDVDFDAKPMVLVLGPHSTGKTTFIRHLIGGDFPSTRLVGGPTEKFCPVFYGEEGHVIPGESLCLDNSLPFTGLTQFGSNFLDKLEGSSCSSNTLKSLSFIDTPGIHTGNSQVRARHYDFDAVVTWFAAKAERIIILFDGARLDFGDEFKRLISSLKPHAGRIRVVLNKSDAIGESELIHVYGSLMWSLRKIFESPEVVRVHITSFSDRAFDTNSFYYPLFKKDSDAVISEIKSLPKQNARQKITELLKRARLVKLHVEIMIELRADIPKYFGIDKKQRQIIDELPDHFRKVARKLKVAPADFPKLSKFKEVLEEEKISKYPKNGQQQLEKLNHALDVLIPRLVKKLNDMSLDSQKSRARRNKKYNPFEPTEQDDDEIENNSSTKSEQRKDNDLAGKKSKISIFTLGRSGRKSLTSKKSETSETASNAGSSMLKKQLKNTIKVYRKYRKSIANHIPGLKLRSLSRATNVTDENSSEKSIKKSLIPVDKHVTELFRSSDAGGGLGDENELLKTLEGTAKLKLKSPKKSKQSTTLSLSAARSKDARLDSRMSESKSISDLESRQSLALSELTDENYQSDARSVASQSEDHIADMDDDIERSNPFALVKGEEGMVDSDWVVSMDDKVESDNIFYKQRLLKKKLTGKAAKRAFESLKLENSVLSKIWKLADLDNKNELDADEFALAMYLGRKVKNGEEVPKKLTPQMIPPSHRQI